jgi:pimeloyl-ACP methyl ester carboxylesterase
MKTMHWISMIFLLFPLGVWSQQSSYVSPAGTQYLLYTPPGYTTGTQSHPLLISLHGKGEMGSDITMLTSNNPQQQPSRLIYLNRWPKDLPFIVLTPLFTPPPDDPAPQWPPAYIDEVVKYVTANYRIDMSRVYITGLSLGGTGTWNYAAAYPDKVAAILPISGRSDLTKACAVKNIPAWVFHGDGDPTVSPSYSIDMINAINACKPTSFYKRKLSMLFSRSHSGWNEIYNGSSGKKVYEWLLKFQKNNTANTAPYVNAGPDRTIMMRPVSFHMYGDYFDSDGTIAGVQWKQVSGPALTLANTTSEFFKISNLQPGTFEFELTVTDNNGATASDRVILTVVSSSVLPVVNNIVLMNGQTNLDIKNLTELMTINKAALGVSQFNMRADASSNTGSVRFAINSDHHTRTVGSPGPYYIKSQSSTSPEWEIKPGHYVISATAYTTSGAPGLTTSFKIKVIDDPAIAGCEGSGKILREIWPGVTGTSVSDIPLTSTPVAKSDLLTFESPTDVWDNFGERIRGYICAPMTGAYRFWIASNDNSELWLSTDTDPLKRLKIASVTGSTNVRQWTKYASQQSALITLQAGTKYYIEALHKEGIESDHLAVGWQLPDATFERPIPGTRLFPWTGSTPVAREAMDMVANKNEEQGNQKSFFVYPNPVSKEDMTLELSGLRTAGHESSVSISIASITGEVLQMTNEPCGSCESLELALKKNLSPGVYVINVFTEGRRLGRRIIVR